MTRDERNIKLREWAKGRLPTMAAVEFLIESNQVPTSYVHIEDSYVNLEGARVWLDFNALADGLEEGRLNYLSGGEIATLHLAISLYNGELDTFFWRLDGERKDAFIRALANNR